MGDTSSAETKTPTNSHEIHLAGAFWTLFLAKRRMDINIVVSR